MSAARVADRGTVGAVERGHAGAGRHTDPDARPDSNTNTNTDTNTDTDTDT